MYIETVPNRNSPPAILLRESYREGGKVKKRTLLNLSDWPPRTDRRLHGAAEGRHGHPERPGGDQHRRARCRTAMSRRRSARRARSVSTG